MLFDTHSHIYLEGLKDRKDEVVANFKAVGGKKMVTIGVDRESSLESVKISKNYKELMYASVGVHPCYSLSEGENVEEVIQELEEIYLKNKDIVIAVGECGYDNFHLNKVDPEGERKLQEKYFKSQIELAKKYDLPLIIHTRDAKKETLETLKETGFKKFIIHCFSEDLAFAEDCMALSDECYFAFGGIATYKSAKSVAEAVEKIPLDRIILETDAPYLAPQKVRGQENEPAFIRHTLEHIAEKRQINLEELEKNIYYNSIKAFNLS